MAEDISRDPDFDYWGEDPTWSLEDWRYEVNNNDTRQGYWEWVATQKEAAAMESAQEDGL